MEFLKNNKYGIIAAAVLLIAAVGYSSFAPKPVNDTEPSQSAQADVVSYTGVDGKTALELLKTGHDVDTGVFSGVGEFVTSIDGRAAGVNEFWAFYADGQMAQTGAGNYKTKNGELIEWKIEKVQ